MTARPITTLTAFSSINFSCFAERTNSGDQPVSGPSSTIQSQSPPIDSERLSAKVLRQLRARQSTLLREALRVTRRRLMRQVDTDEGVARAL
jgi:hypothetical protein